MLSKWFTEVLVLLAVGLGVACVCLWFHEHDICPLKAIKKVMRKMSFIGLCVLALWAVPLIQYGSTKGGGTNSVQMVVGQVESVKCKMENEVGALTGADSTLHFTLYTLHSSTNTTRTITGDDFRRGFVMSRVGTDEAFDFSAPAGATVCADWRAFGAATDWIYESVKWKVESVKWRMQNGEQETDGETMLRIYSDGWAEVKDGPVFYPFKAVLGIVPEANWQQILHFTLYTLHSQFWHYVTPSNTLQITWQNALLDRDTDTPLSFQIEFRTDGQFTYRYDLSRCGALGDRALPEEWDGVITNGVIGASFAGNAWTTNAIPTNVTSMTFYPLSPEDAVNPDPDNDGLATINELFVYHTDPRHPDSDYDGLTDYEELFVYHTNPLDPYSAGGPYSDGVTVKIGDLDPFSYPEGSTNTVLEHIFYSGTTNGAFTYPQSDNDTAILKVMVSGVGTGRLIVGDSVVPLVPPPQMRNGLSGNAFTLLLPVVRGETYPAYVRGDGSLDVTLDSDDFAFGALPTFNSFGHFNFPNTQATPACIHDFNSRSKFVSLPTREDAELLTATWSGGEGVFVSNIPPRSTVINGDFYAGSIKNVSYSLSHPQYLFGQTQYSQPVRFCPRPKKNPPDNPDPNVPTNPEDEYSDTPTPDDPPWFSSGDGDSSTGNDGQDGHWCCYWGTCGGYCECGCGCTNNPSGGSQSGGDEYVGDNEDFDEYCPDHYGPYVECDYVHESEYSNTVQTVLHLNGVMYIREPPLYEPIYLDVPTEHVNCCPCPEHWTNYVGVAYKSYRLRLVDSNGLPFDRTETSCYVNLAGVYPSSAVGDAEIAFTRNGSIYDHHHKTVLGVSIKGHDADLAAYNALNSNFGYPMTACTNIWYAPQMRLVTNVKLPGGHVRLELADASGQFTVWYPDTYGGTYRKLLDTSSTRVKNLSMAYWKALMRRATDGNTPELPIYITSSTPGHVTLKFRYWNVINNRLVEDEAVQCITSIEPPLIPDYNRDDAINAQDVAAYLAGRIFRFWTNRDVWREDDAWGDHRDYAIAMGTSVPNGNDSVVNGRNDLVNLLPLAVRVSPFLTAWGSAATVKVRCGVGGVDRLRRCYSNVSHAEPLAFVKSDVQTAGSSPEPIRSAGLGWLGRGGDILTDVGIDGTSTGFVLLEASDAVYSDAVELVVVVNGVELYKFTPPVTFRDVDCMYRWRNIRSVTGGTFSDTATQEWSDGPIGRPDSECDGTHVVFLHGYNVNEREARAWARAVFKRLWWAGMESAFTAVAWHGDDGQTTLGYNVITPDYQRNVEHAFASASNFVVTVNSLPGRKFMMAHSLGNMVVSAARQDHGLQYEKYFMVNAAVPVEAYDAVNGVTESSRARLTPSAWGDYPQRLRAAGWYALAPEGDVRRGLTWKGRFGNVSDTVNYYSPEDEVLKCGYGEYHLPYQREYAWYNQEHYKGTKSSIQNAVAYGRNEGGWAFNPAYDVEETVTIQNPPGSPQPTQTITQYRHATAGEMTNVTDMALIATPFFGPFADNAICSTNGPVVVSASLRAQLLADAIPAESLPAGLSQVTDWNSSQERNYDMTEFKDHIDLIDEDLFPWKHSYFLQAPYMIVHSFFENIVNKVKE